MVEIGIYRQLFQVYLWREVQGLGCRSLIQEVIFDLICEGCLGQGGIFKQRRRLCICFKGEVYLGVCRLFIVVGIGGRQMGRGEVIIWEKFRFCVGRNGELLEDFQQGGDKISFVFQKVFFGIVRRWIWRVLGQRLEIIRVYRCRIGKEEESRYYRGRREGFSDCG